MSKPIGAERNSMLATGRTMTLTEKSECTSLAPAAVTLAATINAIRAVFNPRLCEDLLKSLIAAKEGSTLAVPAAED